MSETPGHGRAVHLLDEKLPEERSIERREEWPSTFLVFREPVKKHGPWAACWLDSGDVVMTIPFRKLMFRAAPALGFTHGG